MSTFFFIEKNYLCLKKVAEIFSLTLNVKAMIIDTHIPDAVLWHII